MKTDLKSFNIQKLHFKEEEKRNSVQTYNFQTHFPKKTIPIIFSQIQL